MDGAKTLNQLDGEDQSEPGLDSYLVTTVRRLRAKAIGDFTVEDLRLMPFALARLERDPLAAGDYYRGDLLCAVLQVGRQYWQTHPAEAKSLATIVDRARSHIRPRTTPDCVTDHLWELIKAYSR